VTAPDGAAAVANADTFTSYPEGYCLKWVRAECWRIGSLYASAIQAWHGAVYKHPGDRNPPAGAPLFYSGGQYGHIVLARGPDTTRMRSTDCTRATQVNDADIDWPVFTWGDTYLGWTEDLNGVRLPLAGDEDEMTPDDWEQLRRIVREEVQNAKPDYAKVFLAADVNDAGDTVKLALRKSLEHARGD